MKKKIIIPMIMALCTLVSGCQADKHVQKVPELVDPPHSVSDTAKVVRGEIMNIQLFNAQAIPYTEEIGFEIDGTIKEFYVKEGDTVKKGDKLAVLDSDDRSYTSLKEEINKQETSCAESRLLIKYDIKIMKTERKQLAAKAKKSSGADRKKLLKTVKIKDAEIAIEEQKFADSEEIQELERSELENRLSQMKKDMKKEFLYASMDGVIATIGMEVGDQVAEDEFVVAIADNNKLQVKSDYVNTKEIKKADKYYVKYNGKEYDVLKVGYDPAENESEDDKGVNIPATDASGFGESQNDGDGMGTADACSYFDVVDSSIDFAIGSYLTLYLVSGYKENALIIPSNALYKESSQYYVYKQKGETKERTEITVGTITDSIVQIVDGLEEGDVVYVQK